MQTTKEHGKSQELESVLNRYTDLFDFAPIGFVTLDNKGLIREINLTGARQLGTPRVALIGKQFRSFVLKDDRHKFTEHLRQAGQNHDPVATELRITAKGGELIHAQISSSPSSDGKGGNLCLTTITDISELKKTEESLLRLNRLYAVLSETGKSVVYSSDCDTLFRDVCRIAVEYGGFLLAWIGIADMESGRVETVASFGATGYLEGFSLSCANGTLGNGPICKVMREGSYIICNDFLGDPSTRPWHKRGKACGFGSSAAIALNQNGRLAGVLNLYAAEKDFFRWQYINLLKQVAADISFALDNLDREARRRQAESDLQAETTERLRTLEELREKG